MNAGQAMEMIRLEGFGPAAETWYDLGCGTGTFTMALAKLLPPESIVYAVDQDKRALNRILDRCQGVSIQKIAANFLDDTFEWPTVNGVLMANSLHFVKQQTAFLAKVAVFAKRLLIVEYDRSTPSVWQPYPVPFSELRSWLVSAGYTSVARLAERRSRYGGNLYSAVAER
jgi:ubiquinone/menaquinone biosynthesis C-methylase UbiE